MASARLLVFLLVALLTFFIGKTLSDRTDFRSEYPHGVLSHQRDGVVSAARAVPLPGRTVLHTGFAHRRCDEMQQGILHIGRFVGPM
jgi:hypothetical protein